MAISRPLLLLLVLVSSTVCGGDANLSTFLCDWTARNDMNQVESLRTSMKDCSDLSRLPSRIRLPHTKVHKNDWESRPVQDRMAEVLQSLSNLVQDVKAARKLVQAGCSSSLLERLENNANNYRVILTHRSITVEIEQRHPTDGTRPPTIQKEPSEDTDDLDKVLRYFDKLLSGRLELLITGLNWSCP
ncbi:thrombopoietin isoform X2 [Engraulis encrasicolus]